MARIFDDSVEDEKSKVKKDGLIYQQRNDTDYKAEYEKLDSKGKFQFFKDYYLQTIVVIAVLVIVGGYYLYGSLTKPQTVLYVAVCDDNLDEKQVEKLEKAVGTYLGLDNKHEIVTINTDYNSSNGTLSEQLQSYIYAGTCDVVIAPKKVYLLCTAKSGFTSPSFKVSSVKNLRKAAASSCFLEEFVMPAYADFPRPSSSLYFLQPEISIPKLYLVVSKSFSPRICSPSTTGQ